MVKESSFKQPRYDAKNRAAGMVLPTVRFGRDTGGAGPPYGLVFLFFGVVFFRQPPEFFFDFVLRNQVGKPTVHMAPLEALVSPTPAQKAVKPLNVRLPDPVFPPTPDRRFRFPKRLKLRYTGDASDRTRDTVLWPTCDVFLKTTVFAGKRPERDKGDKKPPAHTGGTTNEQTQETWSPLFPIGAAPRSGLCFPS